MRSSWNRRREDSPPAEGYRRFKVTLSYDGAGFFGWQSQRKDGGEDRSVQGYVEAAIRRISGECVTVYGSGRTDSGVHALGQVCHFDSSALKMDAEKLRLALNANLPHGIRIGAVEERFDAFHARFSTLLREYVYSIKSDADFGAFDYGRSWRLPKYPDITVLSSVARRIVGEDIDFAAFDFSSETPAHSTKRDIFVSQFETTGCGMVYRIVGNAFLYHMVRALVGTFVSIASRSADAFAAAEELDGLLRPGSRHVTFIAPACGLYLNRIIYDEDEYLRLRDAALQADD